MIHTRICDLLEIEHPIISAPMSGTAGAELAAAVSEAGGLGLIGASPERGADWLRAQIQMARELTDRPFGVGFISSFPGLDALVQVALEERVHAMSHSFADPTPYVGPAHEAGIKVLAQVQKVSHARKVARAGVDVITAQGIAGGGHIGDIGTLPLVPAVIDAVGDIPVVAAGGIADGRGVAAALMLGAEGVWMGTRFVASREAMGSDWMKEAAVAAGTDDTIRTKVYDHTFEMPFPEDIGDRMLRNEFIATWDDRPGATQANRQELMAEVRGAVASGNVGAAPIRVGSATGLITGVEPAGDIVRRIVQETVETMQRRMQTLIVVK